MALIFDLEDEEELESRIQEAKKIESEKRQKRWEEERRKRNRNIGIGIAGLILILFIGINGISSKDSVGELIKRQETVLEVGKAATGLAERIERSMKSYSFYENNDTVGIHSEAVISTNAI